MRNRSLQHCFYGSMGICIALSLQSASYAVVADLSDWVGLNNTTAPNNYSVTSATSAGGTFAERRMDESSLSDHTLVGGPFDYNAELAMSGTIQFTGGVDPVVFFGWYHSTNLSERIGIGVADPVPAGSGIRWQTQSGNVAGTGVVSQNFGANTTISTYAPGTYDFDFHYDGAGHMTGNFNGVPFARNYALPTNALLQMDRFGFLQKSAANDDINAITLNVSNLMYTGQTDFTGGTAVPGDYDGNGFVEQADYDTWKAAFGSVATPAGSGADGNSNGVVDAADYVFWRDLLPAGSGSGLSVVPEPASLVFVLVALGLALSARLRPCASVCRN